MSIRKYNRWRRTPDGDISIRYRGADVLFDDVDLEEGDRVTIFQVGGGRFDAVIRNPESARLEFLVLDAELEGIAMGVSFETFEDYIDLLGHAAEDLIRSEETALEDMQRGVMRWRPIKIAKMLDPFEGTQPIQI